MFFVFSRALFFQFKINTNNEFIEFVISVYKKQNEGETFEKFICDWEHELACSSSRRHSAELAGLSSELSDLDPAIFQFGRQQTCHCHSHVR